MGLIGELGGLLNEEGILHIYYGSLKDNRELLSGEKGKITAVHDDFIIFEQLSGVGITIPFSCLVISKK